MKIILQTLKDEYVFDGLSVCNDTPQLAVYTEYDYVYPQTDCSLYEPQVKLVTEITLGLSIIFYSVHIMLITDKLV